MSKRNGFQSDLAAMQTEMASVARIVEAAKSKAAGQGIESGPPPPPLELSATTVKPATNRPKRRPSPSAAAAPITATVDRSNVTTRLSTETNRLLTEAALRQKLKRVAPDTRQDIVEAAIVDWLRKHGYGRQQKGSDEAPEEERRAVDEGGERHAWPAAKFAGAGE